MERTYGAFTSISSRFDNIIHFVISAHFIFFIQIICKTKFFRQFPPRTSHPVPVVLPA